MAPSSPRASSPGLTRLAGLTRDLDLADDRSAHLLLKEGMWKMGWVVGYEHRDAPYQNTRKEVTIQPEVLAQYAGKYEAPKSGALVVTRDNNLLILTVGGDKKFLLHPESEKIFFAADRDLTFEFVEEGTKISKIAVREHGAVVEEARPE